MIDLKPSAGYATIEEEFEGRLRKAFVDGGCDFVRVNSRSQQFQLESIFWAERHGLMTQEFIELDSQSSEIRARLTDKGREHFGL